MNLFNLTPNTYTLELFRKHIHSMYMIQNFSDTMFQTHTAHSHAVPEFQ